jgi:hypothetical protein
MNRTFQHFVKFGLVKPDGTPRAAGEGSVSNAFIVAYQTGKIPLWARRKGTPMHAAARAALYVRAAR